MEISRNQIPSPKPISYRPDIDGLRALAVLSVLFYHLDYQLPGGFVGVDIFFVISGYLITSIILKQIRIEGFSFIDFMARRIRRLFPAMLFLLLCTFLAAHFILFPDDYSHFAQSSISQMLLVSNVFFWHETGGYFGRAGETMPLLHTWSLSVEEQFYLLLPAFLLVLWKWFRPWMATAFVAVLLISLGLCIYAASANISAGFYILPTRAWELGMGALIPIYGSRFPKIQRNAVAEAVALFGLLAMLAAILFFDQRTVFPGYAALLPCVGAFAVIWANQHCTTVVARILSLRVLVGVGIISYSTYLWHWPIIVYARYLFLDLGALSTQLTLALASILAGWLSWKFVEQPFRERRIFSTNKSIYGFWGASTCIVICASFIVIHESGLPGRYSPKVNQLASIAEQSVSTLRVSSQDMIAGRVVAMGDKESSKSRNLLLWGDSHAQAVFSAFDQYLLERNVNGHAIMYPGSVPLVGLNQDYPENDHNPKEWGKLVFSYVKESKVTDVLIVAAWNNYLHDIQRMDKYAQALRETVEALREINVRVWVMAQVPKHSFSVPQKLAHEYRQFNTINHVGLAETDHHESAQYQLFKEAGVGANILDPSNYFYNSDLKVFSASANEEPLYIDHDHLSEYGANYIASILEPMISSDQ